MYGPLLLPALLEAVLGPRAASLSGDAARALGLVGGALLAVGATAAAGRRGMTAAHHAVLLAVAVYGVAVWADPGSYSRRAPPVLPRDADTTARRAHAPQVPARSDTRHVGADPVMALLLGRLRFVRDHSRQAHSDLVIAVNDLLRAYGRALRTSARAGPSGHHRVDRHRLRRWKEDFDAAHARLRGLVEWLRVPLPARPGADARAAACTTALLRRTNEKARLLSAALRASRAYDAQPWGDPAPWGAQE